MSARTQRERAEYAGWGWAWAAFFLGMAVLGFLFTPGDWNLARLAGMIAAAVGFYYSFREYDKAQRRSKRA